MADKENKFEHINMRITKREKQLIEKAAGIVDMPVSQFIRLVMNNISTGICLSSEKQSIVILEESLRSSIKLKAFKLGELQGDSFDGIDKVEDDKDD